MAPRFASFCQKNGRARRQARRRRAPAGRDGPVGAADLFDRQRGSQDDPLPVMPTAGHRASDTAARSRQRAAAVQLPPPGSCCCGERESRLGSTESTVFIGSKGSPSASGGPAARLWGLVLRSWSRPSPTHAGRWTSFTTSSPKGRRFPVSVTTASADPCWV